jgi:hypothetical protein
MGVLLQAFYRPGHKGVRCPADGDLGADRWWDHRAKQAHAIRKAGFTAAGLPPVWKGASGALSVGYDPFDDRSEADLQADRHLSSASGNGRELELRRGGRRPRPNIGEHPRRASGRRVLHPVVR